MSDQATAMMELPRARHHLWTTSCAGCKEGAEQPALQPASCPVTADGSNTSPGPSCASVQVGGAPRTRSSLGCYRVCHSR